MLSVPSRHIAIAYLYFTRSPVFFVVEAVVQSRVLHYHGGSAHDQAHIVRVSVC